MASENQDRILGIDYGEKRIGFAISDALRITAQPLKTMNYLKLSQVFED